MKLANLILAALLISLTSVVAQPNGVGIELALEQDQFLPDEELIAAVRIVNRSGQTLKLGKEADWLTFSIESLDKFIVSKIENPPVQAEFSLESSLAGTKRVNLTPYFNFARSGRYTVTATVKLSQWGTEVTSVAKTFTIMNGTRLQDIEFGVPLEGTAAQVPEVRHYILQQAIFLKQMRLYLRITDATRTKTFKLFALAPMTSFTKTEAQLDQFSNLHVLSQTGARSFSYTRINPDGQILSRETHDYTDTSRPVLKYNAEGQVRVFGGIRRITSSDLPAPQESVTQTNVKTETP
ncbi:MAG: hypothetical protein JWM68_2014 [Verrucomicrobiales bacterium]|nr:hypothetical protein [Verrucomicrobiales bacterium]